MSWAKDAWGYVLMYGREAGKWAGLIEDGEGTEAAAQAAQAVPVKAEQKAEAASSGPSWFGRTFGGLTTGRRGQGESSLRGLPPPGTYKVGEVHGDYVKVGSDCQESPTWALIAERRRNVPAALARRRRAGLVGFIPWTGHCLLVPRGREGSPNRQDWWSGPVICPERTHNSQYIIGHATCIRDIFPSAR